MPESKAKPERLVRLPNFIHFLESMGAPDGRCGEAETDDLKDLLVKAFVEGDLKDKSALMQAFDASRYGNRAPR